MLSMARVLVEAPKLLIADELSLGLAPIIVDEVYESLRRLPRRRAPRCSSSSSTSATPSTCAIGSLVLDHGAVSWEGPTDEAGDVVSQAFDPAG